eukprot:1190145-Prorocentrum_minimum.AAC.3
MQNMVPTSRLRALFGQWTVLTDDPFPVLARSGAKRKKRCDGKRTWPPSPSPGALPTLLAIPPADRCPVGSMYRAKRQECFVPTRLVAKNADCTYEVKK